jgi:benzaldehyde dehydrogenase (NAD)
MAAETGASGIWAGFNVHLAASMLLEAASLTTQINGQMIPSDVPGSMAMAVRQPAGVVLGIAPGMPPSSWPCAPLPRPWPAAIP